MELSSPREVQYSPDDDPFKNLDAQENEPSAESENREFRGRSSRKQKRHDDDDESFDTKYCHECGDKIRVRAEICPKCGVRQSAQFDRAYPARRGSSRDGIKIPLLISAISNILVGLFWMFTCVGVFFTIPMLILCIFEFSLWAKADREPLGRLAGRAKKMAIFEIVIGLVNTPTLICGIIILINSGKLIDPYQD